MQPRRLSILFAFFPYAGNSTGSSMVFDVTEWFTKLAVRLKTEPRFTERISEIHFKKFCDTPITMTRCAAAQAAQQMGADVLIMVDSDMRPDVHLGEHPDAVPFFDTAFDAIYEHIDRGPLVIGAPYGGCPPHENMFVFTWSAKMNAGDESPFELRQYTREEAQQLAGLHACAALPTGLIAYDVRAFAYIEPPYFRYEWTDKTQSQKASTEDVQNTRDISIAVQKTLGYNPLRCAWSSWAGHLKVWCVGKPAKYGVDDVAENLASALQRGMQRNERVIDLGSAEDRLEALGLRDAQVRLACDPDEIIIHETNGKPESFHHKTPEEHLEALRELVRDELTRRVHHGLSLTDPRQLLSVIEVGSWVGESAIAMADTGLCHVHCVDTFCGSATDWTGPLVANRGGWKSQLDRFHKNVGLDRLGTTIFYQLGESTDVARHWADTPIPPADVVFIDADHSYESTNADILAWLPHVKPDGVMIGHDYLTEQFPGVTRAVQEIFGDVAEPYAVDTKHGGFWLVRLEEYHKRNEAQHEQPDPTSTAVFPAV